MNIDELWKKYKTDIPKYKSGEMITKESFTKAIAEIISSESLPADLLVMPKIAGKVDGDIFKEIAEFVELEINEKHSNYWSNIAMGNASARFWHAYKKYIESNFSE